ncbi:MAG: hypothetical protein WC683_06870 [bacterium]
MKHYSYTMEMRTVSGVGMSRGKIVRTTAPPLECAIVGYTQWNSNHQAAVTMAQCAVKMREIEDMKAARAALALAEGKE